MSKEIKQCPDFPFFGASYPDATCIDGMLWDLDSCDEPGGNTLSKGGEMPCPFCNTDEFVKCLTDIDNELLAEMEWDTSLSKEDIADILNSSITKSEALEIAQSLNKKYNS